MSITQLVFMFFKFSLRTNLVKYVSQTFKIKQNDDMRNHFTLNFLFKMYDVSIEF
jgi:hypothetical protein